MEKRLGRGLEELISTIERGAEPIPQHEISFIPVDLIKSNPYQARMEFNEKKLLELAQSIKEKGVIQPIIIKPPNLSGEYTLIVGERRLRAAKLAGLEVIPAVIKDFTDEETATVSLIENLQREDLNPVEEAQAYKDILEKFKLTQEELARIIGKDRSVIANAIRLLSLPKEILKLLISNVISVGHARALLGVSDVQKQLELSKRIEKEKLTVREIEEIVRRFKPRKKITTSPDLHLMEDKIRKLIGLKVKIKIKSRKAQSGKIEIYFHSLDEFDRFLNLLTHPSKHSTTLSPSGKEEG